MHSTLNHQGVFVIFLVTSFVFGAVKEVSGHLMELGNHTLKDNNRIVTLLITIPYYLIIRQYLQLYLTNCSINK